MKCNVTLESLYFFDLNRRSRSRSKRRSHSRSRRRSKSPRRRRSYSRERGRRSRSRSLCHCLIMKLQLHASLTSSLNTPSHSDASCQHWRPRSLSSPGTGGGRRSQRKGQRRPPRVTAAPAGLEVPLGEWNLVPVWNIHFFFPFRTDSNVSSLEWKLIQKFKENEFSVFVMNSSRRRRRRSRTASRSPKRKPSRSPSPRRWVATSVSQIWQVTNLETGFWQMC